MPIVDKDEPAPCWQNPILSVQSRVFHRIRRRGIQNFHPIQE